MKNRMWVICLMGMVMAGNVAAKTEGGLIFDGLDTLDAGRGFDFVLQRACTSSTDAGCNSHFKFFWYSGYYAYLAQLNGQGLMLDLGKLNLDSIKSAPPDSVMKDDYGLGQLYVFFKIAPDSLSKCIGNVYILKTGIDPRPVWNRSFYAKIKILKFIVVDSTQHQIQMVFLWAFNRSGYPDLTTSGLDTFHLDTIPTYARPPERLTNNTFRSSTSRYVFTTATSKFTLPQSLLGAGTFVTVFDLAGKMLGRAVADKNRVVDLRQIAQGKGVLVVRVSPRP